MEISPIDALKQHLEAYGWAFHPLAEDQLLTGFTDDSGRQFPIDLTVSERVVTMTCAFVLDDLFVDEKALWAFLELNGVLPWAKVGVDADHSHLLLAVDCPRDGLSYPMVSYALDVLSEAAKLLVKRFKGAIK
jgi:hypothetical protein